MRDLLDRHRGTIASIFVLVMPMFLLYAHGRADRRTTVVEYALMRASSTLRGTSDNMKASIKASILLI